MRYHQTIQQARPAVHAPQPRRRKRRPARTRALVGLCLASLTALGILMAYVAFYRNSDGSEPWATPAAGQHMNASPGAIPGTKITLGMTAQDIRELYPELNVVDSPNGPLARFKLDGANHTLWFTGQSAADRVYRLRVETVATDKDPDDVLAAISSFYGGPLSVSCSRPAISADKRCHFRWITGTGVPLDIYSRVVRNDLGRNETTLTILAIDADLRSDRRRPNTGQKTAAVRF